MESNHGSIRGELAVDVAAGARGRIGERTPLPGRQGEQEQAYRRGDGGLFGDEQGLSVGRPVERGLIVEARPIVGEGAEEFLLAAFDRGLDDLEVAGVTIAKEGNRPAIGRPDGTKLSLRALGEPVGLGLADMLQVNLRGLMGAAIPGEGKHLAVG